MTLVAKQNLTLSEEIYNSLTYIFLHAHIHSFYTHFGWAHRTNILHIILKIDLYNKVSHTHVNTKVIF